MRLSQTQVSTPSTSSRFGAGLRLRHRGDRLQNAAGDLVGIALRVRTAIFEVALVAVVDEAVRHADGSAAIGHAVVEFVDRLGLVQAGQAQMVVRAVDGDVLVLVLVERGHERFEVFLAADFAHVFGREVAVHAGAVPVDICRAACSASCTSTPYFSQRRVSR